MRKKFTVLILLFVMLVSSCGFSGSVAEGAKAINFNANDLNGNSVNLGDFLGKEDILLVFFATWCPPCMKEVPELIKIQNEYADKGLKLIAVSVDNTSGVVKKTAKKKGINYIVWHDASKEGSSLYKVMGIPTNILINKAGEIIYREHYPPSQQEIESLLE